MSSRLKKVLLAGLAVFVVVIVAGILLAPVLLDINSYRPKIESLAKEKLGRDVQLGELGLSVFPAIAVTVDGISVSDGGGGVLLEAESVHLGAELGPLLSKRLAIRRVVVNEPTVTIRRLADGKWELAELLGAEGKAGGEARVTIQGLEVVGGHVLIEDAAARPGSIVRHELSELDLELDGLDRTNRPFDVSFSTRVPSISPETRIAWSGDLGRDLTAEGELELVAFELAALAAHGRDLGGRDLSSLAGRLDATLDLKRSAEGAIAIDGSTTAAGLVLPREGASALAVPDFELSVDMQSKADGSTVLDRFELATGKTRLSAQGSLESEGDERRLMLELPKTTLRLDELRRLAKQAGSTLSLDGFQGETVRLGGKVRAVADLSDGFALKRVDLDGLTLEGLRLAVVRGKDGRFDFQGKPKTAGVKSKAKAPAGGAMEIAARNVRISDCSVRFEDRQLNGTPVVTEIRDIELAIEKWLPGKTTPVRISGALAGGQATLEGSIGPLSGDRLPVDLLAKLDDFEIAQVAPYLSHYAGLNADQGRLKLESRLRGEKSTDISFKGRLTLSKARVALEGRAPLSLDLTIDHDLSIEKGGDRVRLREITLGLPGGPVGFDGLIEVPPAGLPSFDVGTRGSQRLTTGDLAYLIGLLGAQTGLALDAGEPLVLDARLKKEGAAFQVSGSAKLRKLIVQHALLGDTPLRVARADVLMSGSKVDLQDLLLQLGESDLSGSLSVDGFQQHRVRFDLSSKKADLDELFAFAGRTGDGAEAQAKAADGSDVLGRTRATGRLRVEQATLKAVALTDFDAKLEFADRKLEMKPGSLKLYGGRAESNLTADLGTSPVSYDMTADLSAVQVQDLLKAGLAYDQLSGVGGGHIQLAGRAGSPEAAVAAAKGRGKLDLKDGVLGGLNMLEVLKDAEVFGERSIAELGARLSAEGTSFERLDADYSLSGGVLQIERLFTETPDAKVTATGPVRLLEQRLNLDVVVTFQRELSRKMKEEGSRAAKYFWNDRENAVRIPLKISGPLAKPKGLIDWEGAIAQYAQGEIGRQLGGALGGLLGGGSQEPARTETESPSRTTDPPASPRSETPAPSGTASASGELTAELTEVRTGGNFLVPDVKVRARLKGRDLSHAIVVVEDGSGRELHRDDSAFRSAVDAHYAAGADRASSTSVDVSWELDGKRVAGQRDLKVSVTPVSRSGAKGATITQPVRAKKLF